MKRISSKLILALAAAVLMVWNVAADNVERKLPLGDYHSVVAQHGIEVVLSKRAGNQITIKADTKIIDFIEVSTENGILSIGLKPMAQKRLVIRTPAVVTIPFNNNVRHIEARTSADVRSERPLTGERVTFVCSSSGRIMAAAKCREFRGHTTSSADLIAAVEAETCYMTAEASGDIKCSISAQNSFLMANSSGEIKAENRTKECCSLTATSSGEIKLEGTARTAVYTANSAGEIKAKDFYVGDATATATSAGEIELNFTYKLIATATSGGEIEYTGPGTDITKKEIAGGSVTPLD